MKEKDCGIIRTETIESLWAENRALKDENDGLNQKVDWLMEQIRLLKKQQLDGQLSLLFNEMEAYFTSRRKPNWSPAKRVQFGEEGQGIGMRNARRAVPNQSGLCHDEVEHRLSEDERVCPQCGEPMREIGAEVRETLKLIPVKAILRRDVYYTYACKNCEKNDISTPCRRISGRARRRSPD